jgi:hypothetical protein
MQYETGPLAPDATARAIGPWVRARLARMHAQPSPRVALRAAEWTADDGEPVREWLLAPDAATCDQIEAEVQQWALRLGLYRPEAQTALAEGPCTMLAAVVMPDAPLDRIRLTSMYWTLIIAFDDQVVEAGQSPEPYLEAVPELLLGRRDPDVADPFEVGFAEVGAGIRELKDGEALLPEFAFWVAESIATYVGEWERARDGRLPTLDEHLHDAVANSHIVPGMLLQRLEPGLTAPGEPLPGELEHLARLVTRIARLENDLLSYAKDERDGAVNVCWILAEELGIQPMHAIPSVLAMIRTLRAEVDELLASNTAGKQAETIADWVDACYGWFLTVARYGAAAAAAAAAKRS